MDRSGDAFFTDRRAAGQALARQLAHLREASPVVLALPRGGVPVGYEIAQALDAPLDLILVRKIGAPGQPELAVGAVADGPDPELVVNEVVTAEVELPPGYLEKQMAEKLGEIERRRLIYLEGREPLDLSGRTAILVDDGLATGATVRAGLRALRHRGPKRVVLAVPVAVRRSLAELRDDADEVVCLATPSPFRAIGLFYGDFRQLSDDEVIDYLARARREEG